jgi:hypothetical protein
VALADVAWNSAFGRLRFAVDADAQLAWYRWDDYDYGDPEADERPFKFTPARGTVYHIGTSLASFAAGRTAEMNPGSAAFEAAAPGTFAPWDASDTWNTSFPDPADFAFSGGDRVATCAGVVGTSAVIGTVGHSSGRWYFELRVPTTPVDAYLGITTAAQNNRGQLSGIAIRNNSGPNNWANAFSETGTGMPAAASGDWLGFAWDLDTGRAWVRNATADPTKWYGIGTVLGLLGWIGAGGTPGDPVAGTNGIDFSGLGADVHVCYSSSNNNDDARIYSTPVDLAYDPPGAYSAGIPDGSVAVSWLRRTRMSGELRDSVGDVALNEDEEAYELDVMDAPEVGTVKRAVAGLATSAYSYPPADVAADWGGVPAELTLRVYQISGAVGRGFTREITVEVT